MYRADSAVIEIDRAATVVALLATATTAAMKIWLNSREESLAEVIGNRGSWDYEGRLKITGVEKPKLRKVNEAVVLEEC